MSTARPDQIATLTDRIAPVLVRLTVEQADVLLALGEDDLLALLAGNTDEEAPEAEQPTADAAPEIIVLKLDDRKYELVPFLERGETSVDGDEMVRRAERLDANLGEDDGRFILAHQADIPAKLRGKIAMVFTAWRDPGSPRDVAYSVWDGRRWVRRWDNLGDRWDGRDRLVRRRK